MLATHLARRSSDNRCSVFTPITFLMAVSVVLIASLFSHHKLNAMWYGLSAFAGAYGISPTITMSPPTYLGGYDLSTFLDYDLAIVIGMIGGITFSLLLRRRYESVPNLCIVMASFLTGGAINLLYFLFYDLRYFIN